MTPEERAILIVEKFAVHKAIRLTIPAEDVCDYVKRELLQTRADALEEAARVAEGTKILDYGTGAVGESNMRRRCAAAIRSLKERGE